VLITGTSAATPAFAGMVSLLNDALIAAGKNPLGFLNPMLYSIGVDGLNDITSGNAPGCGTQGFNVCHHPLPLFVISI
jgi:tripeptidyl-peptidase I